VLVVVEPPVEPTVQPWITERICEALDEANLARLAASDSTITS
jgi:hypothetical protein